MEEYHEGDTLVFHKMNATIRYIGKHNEKPGKWVGIELDVPRGRNNGTVGGHHYFECPANHGLFITENEFLTRVVNKGSGIPTKSATKPKEMESQLSTSKSAAVFATSESVLESPKKSNAALSLSSNKSADALKQKKDNVDESVLEEPSSDSAKPASKPKRAIPSKRAPAKAEIIPEQNPALESSKSVTILTPPETEPEEATLETNKSSAALNVKTKRVIPVKRIPVKQTAKTDDDAASSASKTEQSDDKSVEPTTEQEQNDSLTTSKSASVLKPKRVIPSKRIPAKQAVKTEDSESAQEQPLQVSKSDGNLEAAEPADRKDKEVSGDEKQSATSNVKPKRAIPTKKIPVKQAQTVEANTEEKASSVVSETEASPEQTKSADQSNLDAVPNVKQKRAIPSKRVTPKVDAAEPKSEQSPPGSEAAPEKPKSDEPKRTIPVKRIPVKDPTKTVLSESTQVLESSKSEAALVTPEPTADEVSKPTTTVNIKPKRVIPVKRNLVKQAAINDEEHDSTAGKSENEELESLSVSKSSVTFDLTPKQPAKPDRSHLSVKESLPVSKSNMLLVKDELEQGASLQHVQSQPLLIPLEAEMERINSEIARAKQKKALLDRERQTLVPAVKGTISKLDALKKEHPVRISELKAAFEAEFDSLERKYLEDELAIQTKLLEATKTSKRIEAAQNNSNEVISLLETLNSENKAKEVEMTKLSDKRRADIAKMSMEIKLLEQKLEQSISRCTDEMANVQTLADRVSQCNKELTNNRPVSEEARLTKRKIGQLKEELSKKERLLAFKEIDCKVNKEFAERLYAYFPPSFKTAVILHRLQSKVELMNESAEKHQLMHFIECCYVMLRHEHVADEELDNLLIDVDARVSSRDYTFDWELLKSKLSESAKITLTPHLFKAACYQIKSRSMHDEVADLAEQFTRTVHPSILTHFKENGARLTAAFCSEIAKAERGMAARFIQLRRELGDIIQSEKLPSPRPRFQLEKEEIEEPEDAEIPELVRKIQDLEFLSKQYRKFIEEL